MRFDIVLNNLAGLAWTTGKIAMTSDGTPVAAAGARRWTSRRRSACVLEAPREAVHNQVFNVGDNEQNYRVREIAEIVGAAFPGCELTLRRRRRRQPQLPGQLRQDPRPSCPGSTATGTPSKRRRTAATVFERDRPRHGDVHRPRPHPAQAARAPASSTKQLDEDLFWTQTGVRLQARSRPSTGASRSSTSSSAATTAGFFARTFCRDEFEAAGLDAARRAVQPVVQPPAGHAAGHALPGRRRTRGQAGPLHRAARSTTSIVDLRPESPTYLQHVPSSSRAENRRALYVPPFFAHGYQTLVDDTEVLYQVSEFVHARAPSAACATTTRRSASSWPLPVTRSRTRTRPGRCSMPMAEP